MSDVAANSTRGQTFGRPLMTTQIAQSRKSRLFINPAFQLRFMSYMLAIALLGFAIIFLSNLNYFSELTRMGEEMGLSEPHPYFQLIEEQKRLLATSYAVATAIAILFIMVGGFVLSHKIATPIYKMRRHMQLFRSDIEHLPSFKLSDKDFFPELEDIVNESINDFMLQLDAMNRQLIEEEDEVEAERLRDPEDYR